MIRRIIPRFIKDEILRGVNPLTSVAIEPTNRCNLDCPYCHRKRRPLGDMDLDLYYKIIKQVPEFATLTLSYGGESIVHPEFPMMVKYARSLGFHPTVFSNGKEPYPEGVKVITYPKPPPIIFTWDQRFEDRTMLEKLKPTKTFCRELYRTLGVLWNGDVVPCCHCVGGGRVMGNLKATPLLEIWVSSEYRRLRLVGHCENCEFWPYDLEVKLP
jgi:MoaA/NifB/PqqE/SkfB family radical SAM enzyme